MDYKKFKFETDSIRAINNSLRYYLAVAATIILIEGVTIVLLATSQKTVFMPPGNITKEFWIDGNTVSKSYLDMTVEYIANTMLNLTPESADKRMKTILPLITSDYRTAYEKELTMQAAYISSNNLTQIFYMQSIDYSKPGIAVAQGMLQKVIGDRVVDRQHVHLSITYKINNGQFQIVKLALRNDTEQFNALDQQKREEQNGSK